MKMKLYCLGPVCTGLLRYQPCLIFWQNFLFSLTSANKNKNCANKTENSTTKLAECQTTCDTKLLDYVVTWRNVTAVFASTAPPPPVLLCNFHTPCSLLVRLVFLTAWMCFHVRLVPKSSTHFWLFLPVSWFKWAVANVLMTRIVFFFTLEMTHRKQSNEFCLLSLC
jgi:hypothetical protein